MAWPVRLTRRRPYIPAELSSGRAVVVAGTLLIAAHLGVRTWALFGGWFYTDDFRLLYEARTSPLTVDSLTRPYDSQFMPAGRFLAWVVEQSGPLNWTLAATLTLALQAVTSLVCFLMLRSLFGARAGILAPFSFYLFSPIPFPALMWWAASLNQLPAQLSILLTVWAWTAHLRRPRWTGALLTCMALAFGLLFYVKTLLVLIVLAFLVLGYFAEGGWLRRIRYVYAHYWVGLVCLGVETSAFAAYYLTNVPQLTRVPRTDVVTDLLYTYVAKSFGTTVLGGPWLWWRHPNPPTSQVGVPSYVVALCWVVIAVVVVVTTLARRRALRAWCMLAAYLAGSFALLATTRAVAVGAGIGLEPRYLTDLAVVVAITVGLAYLPLMGAVESSELRARPRLRAAHAGTWGTTLLVAACVGGVVSSYAYARVWQSHNPGRRYITNAVTTIKAQGGVVNLADEKVPSNVVLGWTFPYNFQSHLLPITGAPVRFPPVAEELYTLDPQGRLQRADLQVGESAVRGDVAGCGWLVRSKGLSVPMRGSAPELDLWMRIGYLSSSDGEILLSLGAERIRVPVRAGLHDLYVRTTGGFYDIRVNGLVGDQALCISDLEVGVIKPGNAL